MKQWLFYPVIAVAATILLHWLVGLSLGVSALIAFIVWPVGGTLVTADDDAPGGFFNPDGTATPHWATAEFWGKLCAGSAVVCVAFLVQHGFSSSWVYYLVPAFMLLAVLSFALFHRAYRASHHAG